MHTVLLSRVFWMGLISFFILWGVSAVHRGRKDLFGHRIRRFCVSWRLPACLLIYPLADVLLFGRRESPGAALSAFFGIFVHLSLYYAVLLPLLPRLRRHVSAHACALLWIVPNFLYFYVRWDEYAPAPLWVLRPSAALLRVLTAVWLAGFAAVLLRSVFSHLSFRRRILGDARPVQDCAVLAVWDSEWQRSTVPDLKSELRISPHVTTPLSIGLFPGTTCVVLPEKNYTEAELALIFRHEILHLLQEDPWAKVFFSFCTALCWFNPLMWLAMRKSAEDLELSCDEAVLEGAGEEDRHRYASLILSAAGDGRGFTTCLSASAEALRYRLKRVVQPRRLRSGALTVALIFFLLGMSYGFVALSYDSGTGQELIFHSHGPENAVLTGSDSTDGHITHSNRRCRDEAALYAYFASLTLDKTTGGSHVSDRERVDLFYYELPEGQIVLLLTDDGLQIRRLYGSGGTADYYLAAGADWNLVDSLFSAPAKTSSPTE